MQGSKLIVPRGRSRSLDWLAAVIGGIAIITLLGCGVQTENPEERAAWLSDVAPVSVAEPAARAPNPAQGIDYDPWESFNQEMFWFNHDVLDRYALKPAATVWHDNVPHPVRQSLANAFDNLAMPDRFVNLVLQGRLAGAGTELARFLLNATVGIAGLFDVAAHLGIGKSDADTGQTLGTYAVGPGPYLVVPLLPPLTVRDAIGYAADSVLDPLSFFVTPLVADLGRAAGKTVNERANNLELYQDVEDSSLDLYAAVRNGYLQRRQKAVADAIEERRRQPEEISDLAQYAFEPADPPVEKAEPHPDPDSKFNSYWFVYGVPASSEQARSASGL